MSGNPKASGPGARLHRSAGFRPRERELRVRLLLGLAVLAVAGGAAAPAAAQSPLPSTAVLKEIARRAALGGGRVQIAVSADDRIAAAASRGSIRTPFRMWSVSKVATSIALLRAYGWADTAGTRPRADVDAAMRSALVRSGDCAQRQLVVELQEATGSRAAARAAVRRVLADAGARNARVLERAAPASQGCRPYLARTRTPDPYRVALQLGTAEWTITDAARFARALGDGTYPPAITRRVLRLLKLPKQHSDDPFARGLDVTSRLDWGAGQALGDLEPAYKAGWGGSSRETPTFVTEQVIHVRSPAGASYGIAVTYEPAGVPARDDPGLTQAPAALDSALTALRAELPL